VTPPAPPPRLRDALEPWCAAGATGALRVIDGPGGAVYLVDGRVVYAECALVCGVDRRLTVSGRVPVEAWRAALAAGRANRRVGAELVDNGHLTAGELELVVSLASLDAAHVLFDTAVAGRFEAGAGPVIGTVRSFDFAEVCVEVDRRRLLLNGAWPDPAIDTSAVVPARRFPGHHVLLTALQWEIVVNADRRRSPVDLARLLGRDTFATLLEVRRMAQAGLVEPGRPGGSAMAESVAAVRALAASPPEPPPPAEPVTEAPAAAPRREITGALAALPRRTRNGATSLPPLAGDGAGLAIAADCSDSTLVRIRQALESLA